MHDFIANNTKHQWESLGEMFKTFSQGISLASVSAKEYLPTNKCSDRKCPSCFPGCLCFCSCTQTQCVHIQYLYMFIYTPNSTYFIIPSRMNIRCSFCFLRLPDLSSGFFHNIPMPLTTWGRCGQPLAPYWDWSQVRQAPHQDQKQETNPLLLPWSKGKLHSAAGTKIPDLHKKLKAWANTLKEQ